MIAALEARHRLGSAYANLKASNFAGLTKDQHRCLELLVFGFISARHTKSGEFSLFFESFGRKARFTVQELYAKVFELNRLA